MAPSGYSSTRDSRAALALTAVKAASPAIGNPTGPTLALQADPKGLRGIPIAEFMYFVPLISPDPVAVTESPGNAQRTRILGITRQFKPASFQVAGIFEITGQGFQKNTFDPAHQIRQHARKLQQGGVLERQLDTIVVSGAGRGRIEVEGVLSNQVPVVTQVRLRFNDDRPSPVTIGLRDIRFVDGAVRFDNSLVARVNTLTFRRTPGRPKMDVSLASVKRADAGNRAWQNFIGGMKGAVANLLLKPINVDPLGHTTMLDFGGALVTDKPSFTFPKAKNLKANTASELQTIVPPHGQFPENP